MERIVLTGGGTAGHIYPALAVGNLLKEKYNLHYIGTNGMEKDIVKKNKDIVFHEIEAVKFARKLTFKHFAIPYKLITSVRQCKRLLEEIKPVAVFSKGGYVSLPVVIAARRLKIKVISHESDLSMGLANRIILRFCNVMCTAFEETAKKNKKCVFTGQPIRAELLNGKKEHLSFYHLLKKNLPNLLIVGGSSGATFLNKLVKFNIDYLTKHFNVIHITGKNKGETIEHENYFQVDYAYNMGDFLDCADFVISRAGSGAINEFLALQKPMFLIPLSKAASRGDQVENAKLFYNQGFCEMMEEEAYSKENFTSRMTNLIKNDKIFIKNMKKSIKNDACKEIVEIIEKEITATQKS